MALERGLESGAYDFWVQLMQAERWDDLRHKGLWR